MINLRINAESQNVNLLTDTSKNIQPTANENNSLTISEAANGRCASEISQRNEATSAFETTRATLSEAINREHDLALRYTLQQKLVEDPRVPSRSTNDLPEELKRAKADRLSAEVNVKTADEQLSQANQKLIECYKTPKAANDD